MSALYWGGVRGGATVVFGVGVCRVTRRHWEIKRLSQLSAAGRVNRSRATRHRHRHAAVRRPGSAPTRPQRTGRGGRAHSGQRTGPAGARPQHLASAKRYFRYSSSVSSGAPARVHDSPRTAPWRAVTVLSTHRCVHTSGALSTSRRRRTCRVVVVVVVAVVSRQSRSAVRAYTEHTEGSRFRAHEM